jgi:alpha-galactosidase
MHAGPGHWNDTDMLIVGAVGWGRELQPTILTRNEQLVHIGLWALQAAPLMVGADMSRLDPWTVDLLTNDEVLDVVMDTLGVAASRVRQEGRLEVWVRPLHDGTWAAGLFNRGLRPYEVTLDFSQLDLSGSQPVRDLWRGEDLGDFTGRFTAEVPRHGMVMVKVGRPAGG